MAGAGIARRVDGDGGFSGVERSACCIRIVQQVRNEEA